MTSGFVNASAPEDRTMMRAAILALGFLLGLTFPDGLLAKSPIVKVTITGNDLPSSVEITDESILKGFKIWSGPGNFRIENGVRIPIVNDGSILWSQGAIPERPKGLSQYEVAFDGDLRVMYVLIYEYDRTAKKGYLYLPGKGEKWYEVNVRSIYRGVEGSWFHASEEFDRLIGTAILRERSVPAK